MEIAANAVGAHCSRLLATAAARGSWPWAAVQQGLLGRWWQLSDASQELIARIGGRRYGVTRAHDLPAPVHGLRPTTATVSEALASGWLVALSCVQAPARVLPLAKVDDLPGPGSRDQRLQRAAEHPGAWPGIDQSIGPILGISEPAIRLLREAHWLAGLPLLAPSDDPTKIIDLSQTIRIAMGQLAAPAGSPLARSLAERAEPRLAELALSQTDLDQLLAVEQLATGPANDAVDAAIAYCTQRLGAALPLSGWRYDPDQAWADLLWRSSQELRHGDPRRGEAMALLRRLPLRPSLARRVARATWQGQQRRRLKQGLAAHVATWPIWRSGERWRWDLRGRGAQRSRGSEIWREQTLDAWLDHSGGSVQAEGHRVETWALTQLRKQGWDGLHAEGWPWLGLAIVLAWPVVMAPAPQAWLAPWQVLPADWGAPGWLERRRSAWTECMRDLLRDPLAVFQRHADALLLPTVGAAPLFAGLPPLPERALAAALLQRLPAGVVVDLVRILLNQPRDASGLPDLIVWRGTELALWEVKSPSDSLSDQQRWWLRWLVQHDVTAGVLHLAGRSLTQTSLDLTTPAASRSPSAQATPPPTITTKRQPQRHASSPATNRPNSRSAQPGALRLRNGAIVPLSAADWAKPACLTVPGWLSLHESPNPGRLVRVAVQAVLAVRRQRQRVTLCRWHALPDGWRAVVHRREEAVPEGGVAERWRLLVRNSGWLWPREAGGMEPALVRNLPNAPSTAVADILSSHPAEPPLDWRRHASNHGHAAAIDGQLALIGDQPHQIGVDAASGQVRIDIAPDLPVLWTSAQAVRGEATWLAEDHAAFSR